MSRLLPSRALRGVRLVVRHRGDHVARPACRGRRRRLSMGAASIALAAAFIGLAATADDPSLGGAYFAFSCAIVVWGWKELAFLIGTVTGSRRSACPEGARGWKRAGYALDTILHHEFAIVVLGAAVLAIAWGGANEVGAWTFLVLWAMRVSAKLNLFLGVRNLGEDFLPEHLRYLASYFGRRSINPLFPVVVAVSGVVTVALWRAALDPGARRRRRGRLRARRLADDAGDPRAPADDRAAAVDRAVALGGGIAVDLTRQRNARHARPPRDDPRPARPPGAAAPRDRRARARAARLRARVRVGDRRASRVEPRHRRAHDRAAPRVRHAGRPHRLGRRPPDLSAQDPDRPPRGDADPAQAGRPLGFPAARREPVRRLRHRALVDVDLGRARHGGGRAPEARDAQGRRGHRRRRALRRHGLRGAQQRRRERGRPRRRAERQRDVDLARRRRAHAPPREAAGRAGRGGPPRRAGPHRPHAAGRRRARAPRRRARERHDRAVDAVRGAGIPLHRADRRPRPRRAAARAAPRSATGAARG